MITEQSYIKLCHTIIYSHSPRPVFMYPAAFCFVLHGTEFRVVSLPRNGSERNSDSLFLFLFHGTEFRVFYSSAEGYGTEFQEYATIFVPRNGIPSCFHFRGRVRNGIPRGFCPQNSRNSVGNDHLFRLFRLPRNYFFVGNSQPYTLQSSPSFDKRIQRRIIYQP